jgi:hypothetical protein
MFLKAILLSDLESEHSLDINDSQKQETTF